VGLGTDDGVSVGLGPGLQDAETIDMSSTVINTTGVTGFLLFIAFFSFRLQRRYAQRGALHPRRGFRAVPINSTYPKTPNRAAIQGREATSPAARVGALPNLNLICCADFVRCALLANSSQFESRQVVFW